MALPPGSGEHKVPHHGIDHRTRRWTKTDGVGRSVEDDSQIGVYRSPGVEVGT